MTAARTALALVAALGALVVAFLEIDTDVRGLLGDDDQVTAALDTPEGGRRAPEPVLVLLVGAPRALRTPGLGIERSAGW